VITEVRQLTGDVRKRAAFFDMFRSFKPKRLTEEDLMSAYNACVDLLDRNIEAGRAGKLAFIDPSCALTYGELQEQTFRFANLLRRLGIRREERILMVMADTVAFPVIFLGAIRAGVIPVPVNTLLPSDQYAYMLADSRAQALFVSAEFLPALEPALTSTPDLSTVVVVGGEVQEPQLNFATALAAEAPSFTTVPTHRDEIAFWLYSSGSTGLPKGTRHVHSSLRETARLFGQGVLGLQESDLVHSAAKLFFAYGLGNALSFPLAAGATVVLNPARPTPTSVLDLFASHQPTVFCGVPTLFAAILNDAHTRSHPGSARLRICTSAGEALPAHIGEAWKARFGAHILDGVGSTEMLHIFLANAPGDIVYGTSGRAVPGYELRLVDEHGGEVADHVVGELYVKGPTAADGYWNQREKSQATFQGVWARTGDKYTRKDGRYTYCGRADDMFKVSGIWVSPFEIESALTTHEAVLEAAVVPAADEEGLLKPKAFVVLTSSARRDDLETCLQEHVKNSIGKWKYPRWIEVVDALPKTATGKIQRFKLRERTS
jgi:4-hydroxybenzoate-CoA ligase